MKIAALVVFLISFNQCFVGALTAQPAMNVQGAWESRAAENTSTMICSEKYFSVAVYDKQNKKFISTHGGSYRVEDAEWIATIEFHSSNPELVGTEMRQRIILNEDILTFDEKPKKVHWKQLDAGGPGELAGAWLITGRARDGQISKMTPGARRTMKILSGTRFQWIAYNVETKQFSGTGGGSYTTREGKYTENIEFFSRDN
ncbi:MAG TPA: membrane or secreted protein [Chryseosolibacter sp.]|nr:membrane or secreted protein [Chryseosolibacter sp.]